MNYAATRRNQINLLSFPFFSFFFTDIYQIIKHEFTWKVTFLDLDKPGYAGCLSLVNH
jgi:hypothetical protein